MDIKAEYQEQNRSFCRIFVYRFNSGRGFYSELNNLIYAALYCLQNNIQFNLYCHKNSLTYKEGWQDYFLPVFPEKHELIYSRFNYFPFQIPLLPLRKRVALQLIGKLHKKRLGFDYYTHELWDHFRSPQFVNSHFKIPKLGIEGGFLDVTAELIEFIYVFTPSVTKMVSEAINSIGIPGEYAGLHVRGGDKITEGRLYPPSSYIVRLQGVVQTKNVFVLTDDYTLFRELQFDYPDYKFFTLCEPDERGYRIGDLKALPRESIYRKHVRLIASMEILRNASMVVGTYSTNPGIFLAMCSKGKRFIGLDNDQFTLY